MAEEIRKNKMKTRYFLGISGIDDSEKEVTKEQYMSAESSAGFHSKVPGTIATASFSNGQIKGRVEYARDKR